MVRIPCHCKVYLPSKCKCKLRQPGYRPLGADQLVYTTRSFGLYDRTNIANPRRLYEVKEESNTNLVEKSQITLERLYDTCAGYNLRYCPITGFIKSNRDYFKLMIKDVAIIICFLATNFIVFLTIVCKTIVHSFLLIIMGLQWILSVFIAKASSACMGKIDSYWPTRTEELIRTLGLDDEYTTHSLHKYSDVFTNT